MSESNPFTDAELRQLVRQRLISLNGFGVRQLNKPGGNIEFEFAEPNAQPEFASSVAESRPAPATNRSKHASKNVTTKSAASRPPAVPAVQVPVSVERYGAKLGLEERESVFQILREEIAGCTRCSELASRRTQTVFGVGNLRPRLVFLGEAPGEDEDKQGEPFVGRAGQLLDKIIAAMKLSREDVFILNMVKCRPPLNRNPSETELANCADFLERQLEVLQPEIICCLGSVAARTLLRTSDSIGLLRGRFFPYKASKVLVTYHPSYLLRTANQTFRGKTPKRMVWDDMKLILAELGLAAD